LEGRGMRSWRGVLALPPLPGDGDCGPKRQEEEGAKDGDETVHLL